MGSADVLAVASDARRLREHLEHVASRGYRLQFLDVEAGPLRRAPHVDDRCDAGHDDVLLQCANAEFAIDLGVEAGLQLESFPDERRKAGELESHGVHTDRKPGELVGAGLASHRHTRLEQRLTRERDGHAGQHGARDIGDAAEHLAGVLRFDDMGRVEAENENEDGECGTTESQHGGLPLVDTTAMSDRSSTQASVKSIALALIRDW